MTPQEIIAAAEDMLNFGAHEGPCDNEGDDCACSLHVAAFEARQERLRAAVAAAKAAHPITLTPRQSEALAWMCGGRRDPSEVLAARAGLPTDVEPEEVVASQRKWPNQGVYRAHYRDGVSIVVVVFTDYAGYRCGVAANWTNAGRIDNWSDVPTRWEKLDGMGPMPAEVA